MEEFLALYAEYGMIGVVACMFVFMVYQNAKRAESQADDIDALRVHNESQTIREIIGIWIWSRKLMICQMF